MPTYTPEQIAEILMVRPRRVTRHKAQGLRRNMPGTSRIRDFNRAMLSGEESARSVIQAQREMLYLGFSPQTAMYFIQYLTRISHSLVLCELADVGQPGIRPVSSQQNFNAPFGVSAQIKQSPLADNIDMSAIEEKIHRKLVAELRELYRDNRRIFERPSVPQDIDLNAEPDYRLTLEEMAMVLMQHRHRPTAAQAREAYDNIDLPDDWTMHDLLCKGANFGQEPFDTPSLSQAIRELLYRGYSDPDVFTLTGAIDSAMPAILEDMEKFFGRAHPGEKIKFGAAQNPDVFLGFEIKFCVRDNDVTDDYPITRHEKVIRRALLQQLEHIAINCPNLFLLPDGWDANKLIAPDNVVVVKPAETAWPSWMLN